MNSAGAQAPEPDCLRCWIFRVLFVQFGLRWISVPSKLESTYDWKQCIDHWPQSIDSLEITTLFWSLKSWTGQMWPGHSASSTDQVLLGYSWGCRETVTLTHPSQTIWSTPHGPFSILSQSRKASSKAKQFFRAQAVLTPCINTNQR